MKKKFILTSPIISLILFLCLTMLFPLAGEGKGYNKGNNGTKSKKGLFHSFSGGRFYSAVAADLTGDGKKEIIAVGQKDRQGKKGHEGYAAVFAQTGTELRLLTKDVFAISHENAALDGRCRIVKVLFHQDTGKWHIFSSGRGGEDLTGVGFLRQWVFTGKELKPLKTVTFHQPEGQYTHGYPLETVDIDGDKKPEIIYGGFSGKKEVDQADVQAFKLTANGKMEKSNLKPFSGLPVPLRVNALAAVDIDGDGQKEIFIAGRTRLKEGAVQKASFAWWSQAGGVHYKIVETNTPSRLRTLLPVDLNGDGKMELLCGGRIDEALKEGQHEVKHFSAFISAWTFKNHEAKPMASYTWTLDGATRLRTFARSDNAGMPGHFIAAGRSQVRSGQSNRGNKGNGGKQAHRKNKGEGNLKWEGFIGEFIFENGKIIPFKKMIFLKKGRDTRIRSLENIKDNTYLASGFIMDKEKNSTGFVWLLKY